MQVHSINRTCARCGAQFQAACAADVRRGRGKYCSRQCRSEYKRAMWQERFWRKVDKSGDCWLWTSARDRAGYGVFTFADRHAEKAHRISWRLTHGTIPAGLFVCHHCDQPSCVNPAHLFLGTAADNNADMMRKGRYVPGSRQAKSLASRGSNNPRAKVTEEDVLRMRELRAAGWPAVRLAARYGLSKGMVHRILSRKCWAHI